MNGSTQRLPFELSASFAVVRLASPTKEPLSVSLPYPPHPVFYPIEMLRAIQYTVLDYMKRSVRITFLSPAVFAYFVVCGIVLFVHLRHDHAAA